MELLTRLEVRSYLESTRNYLYILGCVSCGSQGGNGTLAPSHFGGTINRAPSIAPSYFAQTLGRGKLNIFSVIELFFNRIEGDFSILK